MHQKHDSEGFFIKIALCPSINVGNFLLSISVSIFLAARAYIICFSTVFGASSGFFINRSYFVAAASVVYKAADVTELAVIVMVCFIADCFAARAYAPVAILIVLILIVSVFLCTAGASVSSGIVLMCYSCGLESATAIVVLIVSVICYVLVNNLIGNMIVHVKNIVNDKSLVGAMFVTVQWHKVKHTLTML